VLAVHADWSVAAGKRWMSVAWRAAGGGVWLVEAPGPVGDPATLLSRLADRAGGQAVALGLDVPIGLPRAYAALHAREPDFPSFLRRLSERSGFLVPCAELAELAPDRPFYPARGRAGMTRAAHAESLALRGAGELYRHCDRATRSRPGGAPLFWTLGANQVGKAAIAAWRDVLLPALADAAPPALWPFDGDLLELVAAHKMVIAETYPAEAMRQLGVRLSGGKTRQADRAAAGAALHAALRAAGGHASASLAGAIAAGFGPEHGQDDGFDSLLGVLCVIGVLDRRRPDGIPADPWLRRWEGWVLGQTDMPTAPP
jgi:hypothetical protein